MTVHELIRMLSTHPPDAEVMLGINGAADLQISAVEGGWILLAYRRHDEPIEDEIVEMHGEPPDDFDDEDGLWVSRTNSAVVIREKAR